MEDKVVAESVHGGGGGEATIREIKDGAEGVAQAGGGGVEEVREQVAALPEDRANASTLAMDSTRWPTPPNS